jgi:hypothetical protein
MPVATITRKDQKTLATGGCSTVPSSVTKSSRPGILPSSECVRISEPT